MWNVKTRIGLTTFWLDVDLLYLLFSSRKFGSEMSHLYTERLPSALLILARQARKATCYLVALTLDTK